jgi:hypothetical protein
MTNISWTNVGEPLFLGPQKLIDAESNSHQMCQQLAEDPEKAEKKRRFQLESWAPRYKLKGGGPPIRSHKPSTPAVIFAIDSSKIVSLGRFRSAL